MARTRLRAAGVVMLTVSAVCCGESVTVINLDGTVDSLTITNVVDSLAISRGETPALLEQLTLRVGDVVTLDVSAFNALGQPINAASVEWRSLDQGVVTVSQSAVVTAWGEGQTDIEAAFAADSVTIRAVLPVEVLPASTSSELGELTISPSSLTLTLIGGTGQLSVEARDPDGVVLGNPPPIVWATSDSSVAEVSSTGLVTLRAFGTASISAASSCCSGDTILVVGRQPVAAGDSSAAMAASSNWATGRGNSLAIMRDDAHTTSPWTTWSNGSYPTTPAMEVSACADSAGVSLPTYMAGMNCYFSDLGRIGKLQANYNGFPNVIWDNPEVGDTIAYRVFTQISGDVHGADHGWESNGGDIQWSWTRRGDDTAFCSAGEYIDSWATGPDGSAWELFCIPKDLYMFEWRAIVTDADSVNYDLCISLASDPATHVNGASNPFEGCLYSDTDFACIGGMASCTQGDSLDPDRKFKVTDMRAAFSGLALGQTQPNPEETAGTQGWQLWTGFAVATSDDGGIGPTGWIGPFIPCSGGACSPN